MCNAQKFCYLPQCTNCLSSLPPLPSVPLLCPSFLGPLLATCPVRLPHARHFRQSTTEPSHPNYWLNSPSGCLSLRPTTQPPTPSTAQIIYSTQQPRYRSQPLSCKQHKSDRQHSLPEGCAAANRRLKYLLGKGRKLCRSYCDWWTQDGRCCQWNPLPYQSTWRSVMSEGITDSHGRPSAHSIQILKECRGGVCKVKCWGPNWDKTGGWK
jgi:hypothetical protein